MAARFVELSEADLTALETVFAIDAALGLETLYRGYLIGPEWDRTEAPGSFDPRAYAVAPGVSERLIAAAGKSWRALSLWLNVGPSVLEGAA